MIICHTSGVVKRNLGYKRWLILKDTGLGKNAKNKLPPLFYLFARNNHASLEATVLRPVKKDCPKESPVMANQQITPKTHFAVLTL